MNWPTSLLKSKCYLCYLYFLLSIVALMVLWLFCSNVNVNVQVKRPSAVDPWPQEQSKRRQQIDQVCQDHGSQLYHKIDPLQNYLIFIPQYNLLFCGIPKAGTTTWVVGIFQKLASKLGVPQYEDRSQRWRFLQHFRIKDMDTLNKILEGNPVSFTNVRHPFERLVSGYLDGLGRFKELQGKTFEQFARDTVLMEANDSNSKNLFLEMNTHWRPSNAYCAFCNIHYKAISKTETFNEDKMRIMELLGLKVDQKTERLHAHGGNKIQALTRSYLKNITEDVRVALVDLYKYDFAMFDYEPDLY